VHGERTPTSSPVQDAGLVTVDAADEASVGTNTPPTILPDATYSGFDDMHQYRVPIAVYGTTKPTLTASDPSMVSIQPTTLTNPMGDKGVWFMVTTLKAGTVTLTATTPDGQTVSSTMTITDYSLDRYAAGATRYSASMTTDPPCVNCHGGANGIDHSPSRMASATDAEVIGVIRTGILVEGSPITQVKHQWKVTDTEAAGLVAYLRALAPRGFTGM
jgi:hypothetical protein